MPHDHLSVTLSTSGGEDPRIGLRGHMAGGARRTDQSPLDGQTTSSTSAPRTVSAFKSGCQARAAAAAGISSTR
jgi:hypothetical protein